MLEAAAHAPLSDMAQKTFEHRRYRFRGRFLLALTEDFWDERTVHRAS
jgi:hypothetical protein